MSLVVHFLNVGQGDCTIIEFPSGRVGIVDIDNLRALDQDTARELLAAYHESFDYLSLLARGFPSWYLDEAFLRWKSQELTDPLAYYDAHIGPSTNIFRFVVTHPDMDHMTGLHRLHAQDGRKGIINFWHTGSHTFNLDDTTDEEWENCRFDKRDWETYKSLVRSADNPKGLKRFQGNTGSFWSEDGIELWAPTPELERLAVAQGAPNVLSMVLKIGYMGRTIVLGGDATAEESWPAIMDRVGKIDVLKASHHGRESGYYWPAVKQMAPWLTITSVGQKAYDATEKYRRDSDYTVSLRDAGDIKIIVRDDGVIEYPSAIEAHWMLNSTRGEASAFKVG